MATSFTSDNTAIQDIGEMKEKLCKITSKIDNNLYAKLLMVMCAPINTIDEYESAEMYFMVQLIDDKFYPWKIAEYLEHFGYNDFSSKFKSFARQYKFDKVKIEINNDPKTAIIEETNPKISIMKMLKFVKSELSPKKLLFISFSKSKTFESIFSDMLILGKLTPDLAQLKQKLQKANREDMATEITMYSEIISKIHPSTFSRTVRLCLDTMDVNIFSILAELRDALLIMHSTFHTLDEEQQTYNLSNDYIPLTFTSEVDTRTLPLTEGSDAELQTLLSNYTMQVENKAPHYVDALQEIYTLLLETKLICLIGHPGTGKTIFCKKLINRYATEEEDVYRCVLLIACRDSRWHTLEEDYQKNIHMMSEKLEQLMYLIIPHFSQKQALIQTIINAKGRGVLLIIDSLDEFPQQFKFDSTLLYQILIRQFLPHCTLLLTSRPGAWNLLTRSYGRDLNVFKSWQVLGFSVEQRNKFINTILKSPAKITQCFDFLSTRLELNILSLVPINISLITSLIASTESLEHIQTLTDLYTNLILFTLDRQLKRIDKLTLGIPNLQDMPADMLAEFRKLTELSYEALLKRQITFSSAQFPNIQTPGSKYTTGLGLFQIIRVKTVHQSVIDYFSTPHLTFQEYLSAWHLSQLPTKQLTDIIQQIFLEEKWPAMKVCVRFLLGLLTKGHANIIQILIENIHRTPTPLLQCKYALVASEYNKLYEANTTIHLSLLPYIVETKQESILSSHYKLLTPSNNTAPHFYLSDTIPPIDANSLYQFLKVLPPTCSVSALSVDITQLNRIQIDMLQKTITCISIDTLIVKFSSISNLLTNLINTITLSSTNIPKHIYYDFNEVHLMKGTMTTQLTSSISSTVTYVKFDSCKFTPQVMTLLVSSLHRLEYLEIISGKLNNELFSNLKKLKGIYLYDVLLPNEAGLYEYLQSQKTLQEIRLSRTTASTPTTLHAIQHLSSLQHLYILANDYAVYIRAIDTALLTQHPNTTQSLPLFLSILHNNANTLSYMKLYCYRPLFTEEYYDTVLRILSSCTNLQCIDFFNCRLTPRHMTVLANTLIKLPALVGIDMSYNSGIGDEGLMFLSEAFITHSTVRWINLSGCSLSSSSTQVIISLMKKCPNLLYIDLHANGFDADAELTKFAQERKITFLFKNVYMC